MNRRTAGGSSPLATPEPWNLVATGYVAEKHRRLDRYGARRDEMRSIFDSEQAWTHILELFARAASA